MLTFKEIQEYIARRYSLDAAMAAETTKMLIDDIVAAIEWPRLYDLEKIAEYCDFLEED